MVLTLQEMACYNQIKWEYSLNTPLIQLSCFQMKKSEYKSYELFISLKLN